IDVPVQSARSGGSVMRRRKKLSEQVVVITGASSGIGLVTAKMAAERGARVVLAARNEHELRTAADAIVERGGRAIVVPTDVAVREQVGALAGRAVEEYGRFDTWINGADPARLRARGGREGDPRVLREPATKRGRRRHEQADLDGRRRCSESER